MKYIIILLCLFLSACGSGPGVDPAPANNVVAEAKVLREYGDFIDVKVKTASKSYNIESATFDIMPGDKIDEVKSDLQGVTEIYINGEENGYVLSDDFWVLNDMIPDDPAKEW